MAKALRYYAQWGSLSSEEDFRIAAGILVDGWLIFDRNYTSKQGADLPFALAVSRAAAFRIRGALNQAEAESFK